MDSGKERQYSEGAEALRIHLYAQLRAAYGFTWEELVKLTGMRLSERTLSTLRLGVDPDEYGSIVQ